MILLAKTNFLTLLKQANINRLFEKETSSKDNIDQSTYYQMCQKFLKGWETNIEKPFYLSTSVRLENDLSTSVRLQKDTLHSTVSPQCLKNWNLV